MEQDVPYQVQSLLSWHVEKNLNKSCELGIKYVNQSIKSNLNYGKGHGPINHLNSFIIDRKFK